MTIFFRILFYVIFAVIIALALVYLIKKERLYSTLSFMQEALYKNSKNAYILIDPHFYFLAANEMAFQLFPEQMKLLKKSKRSERYLPSARNLYESSKSTVEYQANGKYYSCTMTSHYRYGSLVGYVLSLVDITTQKNEILLEKALKKAAEEKSLQKSRIMIQTSHDLRSPLHTIIGCCNILMRKFGINGEHMTIITQIEGASRNLLSLVNDMLNFTKLELGNHDSLHINENDLVLESSSGLLPMEAGNEYIMAKTGDTTPAFTYPTARVLIADDMKLNQYIFKELTAPWKFTVDTVMNGQEAIDAVKKNHYDLIFLDRLMPVLDGLDACISIKEITNTPLVLLSANMSEYDIAEYEPYGFNDYMTKPFTVERLKTIIETNIAASLRHQLSPSEAAVYNEILNKKKIDNSLFWGEENDEDYAASPAAYPIEDSPYKNQTTSRHTQISSNAQISGNTQISSYTQISSNTQTSINISVSPLVLKSYIDELKDIQISISGLLETDNNLFRTKVHGIKGISRQVGFMELGESSEIMEMAIKANHIDYIKRHLPKYLEEVDITLSIAQNHYTNSTDSTSEAIDDDLFDNF